MLHHAYCIAIVLSCDISNIQRTYSVTSFNHSYFNAVERRLNYIVLVHVGSHGKVRISHLLIQLVLLTISLIKLTHSCCLLPSSKGHLELFWFSVSVVDIYLFDWQWVRVVAHCRPEKDIAAFAFGREQQEVQFDAHSCCLFLKSSKGDLDTFDCPSSDVDIELFDWRGIRVAHCHPVKTSFHFAFRQISVRGPIWHPILLHVAIQQRKLW